MGITSRILNNAFSLEAKFRRQLLKKPTLRSLHFPLDEHHVGGGERSLPDVPK